jgi:hypothetical protein
MNVFQVIHIQSNKVPFRETLEDCKESTDDSTKSNEDWMHVCAAYEFKSVEKHEGSKEIGGCFC